MFPVLSLSSLSAGISWWLKNWSPFKDFLNADYYEIYNLKNNGLTEDWWDKTVSRLSAWRAIRSRRPPNTITEIRERGLHVLPNLKNMYSYISNQVISEPSLVNFKWDQLNNFYNDLAWIKNSGSPVFPSKLGHFIFPSVFIVIDNTATGIYPYASFWISMQRAWVSFNGKEEAKELLSKEIIKYSDKSIHSYYPFETKIIELCTIGKKYSYN